MMTNEHHAIKSIVDAGYRLVVYTYCFLNVSGVVKILKLRPQDNPRRWIPFLSTILLGWLNTRHTLTLLSLYGRNLLNGCDLTAEIYCHVVYQGLPFTTFDFRDAVGCAD